MADAPGPRDDNTTRAMLEELARVNAVIHDHARAILESVPVDDVSHHHMADMAHSSRITHLQVQNLLRQRHQHGVVLPLSTRSDEPNHKSSDPKLGSKPATGEANGGATSTPVGNFSPAIQEREESSLKRLRPSSHHAFAQSVTLTLGAVGCVLGMIITDSASAMHYLCMVGALLLTATAVAALYLSMHGTTYLWAAVIVSWPPLRDALVLLSEPAAHAATTSEALAQVNAAFYFTRVTFFLLGILHHMTPKPLRWRLSIVVIHTLLNLLCTANMTYPHIGDTPPVLATSTNEIIPFVAGIATAMLTCGNERVSTLPVWPSLWAGHTLQAIAPERKLSC